METGRNERVASMSALRPWRSLQRASPSLGCRRSLKLCLAAHSLLGLVSEHSRLPMGAGIRPLRRRLLSAGSAAP